MARLCTRKQRYIKRVTVNALLVIFVLIYIITPLIFMNSYTLQQGVVFSSFVDAGRVAALAFPSFYRLEGVRNFYYETEDDLKLGVWQMLPDNVSHNARPTVDFFESTINNGQAVIIYYHGNSGNRGSRHRLAIYKILRKYFHVITFDYRDYGDSSSASPTESSVVKDCISIYLWVTYMTTSKIFVWGHSLGTALSVHMLSILSTKNIRPAGLILESPFTNMREEIFEHPLSKFFKIVPWFHSTIVEPIQDSGFIFATDKHILNVDCPILILHAEDDGIVPYKLGYKLYDMASRYRKPQQGSVKFVPFEAKFGYGHKQIYKAPKLPEIIGNFITSAIDEMKIKISMNISQ